MATTAKENILKRVRQALSNPVPLPFPNSEGSSSIFVENKEELDVLFAQEFTKLQGKFAFCVSKVDMIKQVQYLITEKKWDKVFCVEDDIKNNFSNTNNLSACDVSITNCESLVARTGSIVLSAAEQSGRTVSVYAPIHVCIAYTNQLMFDVKDALQKLKEKYGNNIPSLITFATGPSRTADIEKTLVTGVHGPKEVYCFLVDA